MCLGIVPETHVGVHSTEVACMMMEHGEGLMVRIQAEDNTNYVWFRVVHKVHFRLMM